MKRLKSTPTTDQIEAGAATLAGLMPGKNARQLRTIAAEVWEEMVKAAPDVGSVKPYPDLTARQAQAFETAHELTNQLRRRFPTYEEIGEALGVSKRTAWHLCNALARHKYLKKSPDGRIRELAPMEE